MSSIRLGELFACVAQGGALVAEAADGRLLHIDDVRSGLACNCTCPGCGRSMVAKKGDVQTHHFAHYAQQEGRTCVSAGETALHKFAKRILDERLEITLPAMVVSEHGEREVVVAAERRSFDRAILEVKDGQIVPDVVLVLRDRRLIVEFKVTHGCDEQKIANIKAMDIGAIEIDLSSYRDRMLSEISDQILYDAPRLWLHNPRERQAREKVEERARQRNEEKNKQVERLRSSYRHRSPAATSGSGASEVAARNEGLGDLINLPVDGAGCFTVPLAEWQAAVLLRLVADPSSFFRTRNGLAALRQRGWLDQNFADISDEIASAVRQTGNHFNSPMKTVEAYLQEVERRGFAHSGPTETWRGSGAVRRMIEDARERRERPARRMADIRRLVSGMLSSLPEDETASFEFDKWWAMELPDRGYSAGRAAEFQEEKWRSFRLHLENIPTQIRFSPREQLDLMGLPYDGALARAIEGKRVVEEARELARQQKLETDRSARVANLRNRAVRQIGDEAEGWLNAPNPEIGGRSPLDSAASNESGYDDAVRALDARIREIQKLEQARKRKAKAVATLHAVAESRYYDPARAALWMRSGRHELGGKSPEVFTVDDATRQRCIDLLPATRSRR